MLPLTVLNDVHLGVNRSGGTTPASFAALTEYTHECFEVLLDAVTTPNLLINGDIFDGFLVDNRVLVRTYKTLMGWLRADSSRNLYLARGNHDVSRDGNKLSSFDLLGMLLTESVMGLSIIITEPYVSGQVTVLPHAVNQDEFNLWVDNVIAAPTDLLFVHANYDNNFAAESDHSLNLSAEQAKQLREAGVRRIIFGHEHQQREAGNGVLVVGNQFPTSVADCLGNDSKRLITINELGVVSGDTTWVKAGSYFTVDWTALDTVPESAEFVRVAGNAEAGQAADALEAISRLRKRHSAFVITNAVVVDGRALDVSAMETTEAIELFDVTAFLKANMETDEQRAWIDAQIKEKANV